MTHAKALVKRTHVYVQRPAVFEIAGCNCGNADPDWSEYKDHLWCASCQKDFIPKHWGVFEGPVGIKACGLIGMFFDRINLATGELEPDPLGNIHFSQTAHEGRRVDDAR